MMDMVLVQANHNKDQYIVSLMRPRILAPLCCGRVADELLKEPAEWVSSQQLERETDGGRRKTLQGQKKEENKMGRKVHCQNPWGETKEKIIILNQKYIIHFGGRTSRCSIIYHHHAPLVQTDDPLYIS